MRVSILCQNTYKITIVEGSVLREGDVIVTILWKRLSIADDIKEISRIFS